MLIIREAVAAIRRTPMLSMLTAIVIAISLALTGIVAMLSVRASETLDDYRAKLPIEAYFDAQLASDAAEPLAASIIKSLPDISTSKFISKEAALKEYSAYSGEDLQGMLGYNPLPAGIRMTFNHLTSSRATAIISMLKSSGHLKDILFDGNTLRSLEDKKKTLVTLTYSLGIFLLLVSVLLAASLARLAMQSRREAIRAMSLLGARRSTIVIPYYIEGTIAGFLGGMIAAGSIIALHLYGLPRIAPELILMKADSEDAVFLILASATIGSMIGLVGATITSLRIRTI
ncbi:MAG TPA: permease-like cell division protein FtsX [Candidatus Kapabacteria bacterium]|nr:permease-like cell division protein FtsX [Candidatus Kapabacteria bacterium]